MLTVTTFADGPAAGQSFHLQRSPVFLRIVLSGEGQYDALDQLDDAPAAEECIFAYRVLPDSRGTCHVDAIENGRRVGRWYELAKYVLYAIQPLDSVMRDNDKWRAWCAEQVKEKA